MQQTLSTKFPINDPQQVDQLRSILLAEGFNLRTIQYSVVSGTRGNDTVTLYTTGKLVIQGPNVQSLKTSLIPNIQLEEKVPRLSSSKPSDRQVLTQSDSPWIGTDESGKGDYFGPLVIAGVLLDSSTATEVKDMGARDSKTLSDASIQTIAPQIMRRVPNTVVAIGPKKYNELYEKMGNVNSILAWGHARCIENLLEKHPAVLAIADQFGNEQYIKSALMQKGKQVRLEQRHHAEENVAVAAASVLARREFVRLLASLGQDVGTELPKGASSQVEETGRRLVKEFGPDILLRIAKVHFRTTSSVLNQSPLTPS